MEPQKPDRDALIKGKLDYAETRLRRDAPACFDDAFNYATDDIVKCINKHLLGEDGYETEGKLRGAVRTAVSRAISDAKSLAKNVRETQSELHVTGAPAPEDSETAVIEPEVWQACDDAEDSLIVRRLIDAQSNANIAAELGIEETEVHKRIASIEARLRAMCSVTMEDLRLLYHRRYLGKGHADIAFVLCWMNGLSETEIAAKLEIEVTEVRKRIKAIAAKLGMDTDGLRLLTIENLKPLLHLLDSREKSYAAIAKGCGLFGVTHPEQVRRKLEAAERLSDDARHRIMERTMPCIVPVDPVTRRRTY